MWSHIKAQKRQGKARPMDRWELKYGLGKALESIPDSSSFAIFKSLQDAPNPGLVIERLGSIGLPLSVRDEEAIIYLASGTNVFENPASAYQLQNPAWTELLNTILPEIKTGLRLDPQCIIEAELSKLTLYLEGSASEPNKALKGPNVFGTLRIALPTHHEGGEIQVTHGSQIKNFKVSEDSAFGCSHMTWYSTAIEQMKPLTAGRRLVLTNMPQSLAHVLMHDYGDGAISSNVLEREDVDIVTYLRDACARTGTRLYLGQVEHNVVGHSVPSDHEEEYNSESEEMVSEEYHIIEDKIESDSTIKAVFDTSGATIAHDVGYDEEDFILSDPLGDYEPDEEVDYGEDCIVKHTYRRLILILLPNDQRTAFFFQNDKTLTAGDQLNWFSILTKEHKTGKPAIALQDLEALCTQALAMETLLISRSQASSFGSTMLRMIITNSSSGCDVTTRGAAPQLMLFNGLSSPYHLSRSLLLRCLRKLSVIRKTLYLQTTNLLLGESVDRTNYLKMSGTSHWFDEGW
ncbi:uncharacterized protein LY89DRAFT_677038 [Mollisia scopiformis]|uniref:Uncharacterized protein n=1 Tax=Mollisia scopiformis TaxID=149040 RepID=A0A132B6W1_MOLSC|nr:uncharacterized protein LY89DRAFT_677038 [Mollisia scopiformis]KUJ08148.1 hypothetical protein LY89DRAFT_677038 [Mollisia scopiformis]